MSKQDDPTIELSRRKTLTALGTIGVASAGAGLGTSAYFNDTESFDDNQLTAGELDLKVDWEEHYSDWSPDEEDGLQNDVLMEDPSDSDYVGLPNPNDPLIWVHMDDLDQFMDNTSIEAYPDENGDGIQDQDDAGNPVFPNEDSICDTDSDLPTALDSDLRTPGHGQNNGGADPLVQLNDVKPGDFGELTLSFHLCDNPGYVWMRGDCTFSENGVTEPEGEDPDEMDDVVELADEIQTVAWYDQDGDNVLDGGGNLGDVCAHLVLDSSGSMTSTDGDGISRNQEMKDGAKQLAEAILDAGGRVGVTEFDNNANEDNGQGGVPLVSVADNADQTTVDDAIDTINASGNTAIDTGIDAADADLGNCDGDERAVMIVVTDGQNNAGSSDVQTASDAAINSNTDEIFAIGTGGANQGTLTAIANPDDDAHIELTSDLTNAIANLVQAIGGEQTFFEGTLRDLCTALSSNATDQDIPGIPLDGNRTTDARDCFNPSDTNHIGLAWWLPTDVGNEVQTDSVEFDLGFYTEQCRHNDGSGMATSSAN